MALIGYARVSSVGQSVDVQRVQRPAAESRSDGDLCAGARTPAPAARWDDVNLCDSPAQGSYLRTALAVPMA